jgi:MYXO-CTERM domain-containing protein
MIRSAVVMRGVAIPSVVVGAVVLLGCAHEPGAAPQRGTLEARFGVMGEAVLGHAVQIEIEEHTITLHATGDRREALVLGRHGRERATVTLRLANGVDLQVLEDGERGAVARDRGALVQARPGGASYWTVGDEGGFEEWLALDEAYGDQPIATWEVAGHTLREVPERGVHVLRDGAPVAFVSAPRAVNDRGERIPTWLRVEGDRLALYVDGEGSAVLADPLWVATGSLAQPRTEMPVVLVPGGALILGGYRPSDPVATLASIERYDELTGVWSSGGTLLAARGIHGATTLATGAILLAGGDGPSGSPVATAERYDPVTEISSAAGSMSRARVQHTLTRLPSGAVLAAGGSGSGGASATADLYEPSTNTWTPTGNMAVARSGHSATLLASGRVLVIGGAGTGPLSMTAELYDPATGTFSPTGSLSIRRHGHSATLLPGGQVLVAGGRDASYLASAELYDPSTGTFTPTGSMSQARNFHSATLLASGRVLIAGGANGPSIASAEIYDPASGTFSAAPPLSRDRVAHGAVLLPSGRVLVAGGDSVAGELTFTELFDESPICGNGELETGEACDDGNTVDGDCCDGDCGLEANGTMCRGAVSPCDITERCSGTSGSCPEDIIADSVTTCRSASCFEGEASPVTHCTGFSTVCPPPTVITCAPFECAELVCGECDGDADCSGLRCVDHLCVDLGDAGTDAGSDAGIDAGHDAGGLDAGASVSEAGVLDASVGADAGAVPVSGGCGCSVPRTPSRSPISATLLAALIGIALRQRSTIR